MSRGILTSLRCNIRKALAERRLQEAGEILARLRREDPMSPETRGFELEYLLETGRLVEAEKLGQQLCRLYPRSARICLLLGKTAYRLRHYGEAERCFRESQRLFPHPHNQYWLGRTLTQLGGFEEAEALLVGIRTRFPRALLDLAWLHQRRGDLQAALEACDAFLVLEPDNDFAREQKSRIKAGMMDPEALIEEVGQMEELGESIPSSLLPDFVARLFQTGQVLRAREEVEQRRRTLEPRTLVQLAWVCYRARAFDLACTLFLSGLEDNLTNPKYLVALETAARRSGRVASVIAEYEKRKSRMPNLYGRLRALLPRGGAG